MNCFSSGTIVCTSGSQPCIGGAPSAKYSPIPKIKDLNAEYERILIEKKETYSQYRQAKQELKDYQTAKYNVDQFLKKNEAELDAQRKKQKNKSL